MRYLILIYENESNTQPSEEEMRQWFAVTDEMRDAGVMLAGEALQPTSTATTVRVRDGKTLTTDGPFAETKEQFGGFYMVECADLDEALGWARKMPNIGRGSIEVRPVVDFEAEAGG